MKNNETHVMEADRFRRIRRIILSRVLLVPFIAVMLVFGTLVYYFATNLRDKTESELVLIADGHRRLLEQFLCERSLDLQYIAWTHSFEELSQDRRLDEVFEQLQMRSQAFFDIGAFDEDGNHVAYVGPYDLRGKNYAQAEWFQQVQRKGMYISDVFLGYRNIPHFIIAVRREDGGRIWYVRGTIDTLYFNDLVESIRVGKTGEAYLINQAGIFQTRRRSGGGLMEVDPDHAAYEARENGVASFTADDQTGRRHLYATGRLSSTGWLLVVRQEIGDAYHPLIRAVMIAVIVIVGGGAVVVTVGFLLASSVANRLTLADAEKRRMGSQLIMAGKLAEVGEMSAGVAHEINNPLQVMKSEEALMKDILAEMEADGTLKGPENIRMLRDSLAQIGLQIDRCKRITQGLLGFARESEAKVQTVDLRLLIPEVVAMIERRAQVENVHVVHEFAENLPPIPSDPAQLQQVLLNLLNNALYALKEKGKGEIRITATPDDNFLAVAVADDGCGIAPENLKKVFLPFYTTKPVGKGTGLGLSTCYGIVERLGGQIAVTSELNVGTVFTVRLPLSGPPEGHGID